MYPYVLRLQACKRKVHSGNECIYGAGLAPAHGQLLFNRREITQLSPEFTRFENAAHDFS